MRAFALYGFLSLLVVSCTCCGPSQETAHKPADPSPTSPETLSPQKSGDSESVQPEPPDVLKTHPTTVELGKKVPDFEVTGIDGKQFKLYERLGKGKHIVLAFSRAHW